MRTVNLGGGVFWPGIFYTILGYVPPTTSGSYQTGAEITLGKCTNGTHIVIVDRYDTGNLPAGQMIRRQAEIVFSGYKNGPQPWEQGNKAYYPARDIVIPGQSGEATIVDMFVDIRYGRPVTINWFTLAADPYAITGGETWGIDVRGFMW